MFLGHTYALSHAIHKLALACMSILYTHIHPQISLQIAYYVITPERERSRPSLIRHQQTHTLLTAVCQTLTAAMLLSPCCSIQMACFGSVLSSHYPHKYLDFSRCLYYLSPVKLRCFITDRHSFVTQAAQGQARNFLNP